jgi:hypothetical protein
MRPEPGNLFRSLAVAARMVVHVEGCAGPALWTLFSIFGRSGIPLG